MSCPGSAFERPWSIIVKKGANLAPFLFHWGVNLLPVLAVPHGYDQGTDQEECL